MQKSNTITQKNLSQKPIFLQQTFLIFPVTENTTTFLTTEIIVIGCFSLMKKSKQYIGEKPQLLSNDSILLKKYNRLVNNEKDQIALYLFYIEGIKETVSRLIQQVKTQYNFK